MTHLEAYTDIINFRKSNKLSEEQYGELHHIVPKSVCPILKKAPENMVRLTAQEHFMAHYHLWLAFRDELHEKKWAKSMCFALHRMKQQLMKCDDVEAMARLYEEARIEFSKLNTGKNNPMFGKRMTMSDEHCKHLSESKLGAKNPMFGKKRSEQACRKCSESLKGHKGYWTGKKNPKLQKTMSGRHWFNNGVQNRLCRVKPSEEWVEGRIVVSKQ